MALRRNVAANYAAQTYMVVIGIAMVPIYLRLMGAEAYGLVAFFSMMQSWFNVLDIGLSPTLARETARFRGGAIDGLTLRRLMRSLEGIFGAVAVVGAVAVIALSDVLAERWLNVDELAPATVRRVIMVMAGVLALRWACSLYRAAINGYERQVWLSTFNIGITSARFLAVVPALLVLGTTPMVFFSFQLAVAVVEFGLLAARAYSLLPREVGVIGWSLAPVRKVLGFSLTLAFTSTVWVAVTQSDKLVLSKLLSLSHYGYFAAAALAASGVMLVGGPIAQAVQPRLARLAAEQDEAGLIALYRRASQAVCVIAMSAAATLAAFSRETLWAWTGDRAMTDYAAPILSLYALGNGILAVAAFPYYLQFAKGDLRLHLIGNAIFLVLLVPALIWATTVFGGVGAGYAWLFANMAYFVVWVPLVHRRLAPGIHLSWLVRDVGMVVLAAAAVVLVLVPLVPSSDNRSWQVFLLVLWGGIVFVGAALTSPMARGAIVKWLARRSA